jgi:hypothetical protein
MFCNVATEIVIKEAINKQISAMERSGTAPSGIKDTFLSTIDVSISIFGLSLVCTMCMAGVVACHSRRGMAAAAGPC